MAQYYQVTSLEELHHLYPNLQLDNVEGIQCMIQDDQVTQYSDGQEQQVIAAVDQTNIQVTQNTVASPQCTSHQNQFVLHQPTQYVIQQIDANDPQNEAVQYVQQRQKAPNQGEDAEVQFPDPALGCPGSNTTQEEHSLKHCIVKSNSNKQFLTQMQPLMHQPIQIHQQIQAVDVGPNVLVLQNQDQEVVLSSNKRPELMTNQQERPHHIIIQRPHQQKPQQVNAQIQHVVQKEEISSQHFVQKKSESRQVSQSGVSQPQILNHSDQQLIQQLQYYNQVTVIDGFTQQNVTIEQSTPSNDNMGHHQQMTSQVQQQHQQQYKQKKVAQPTGLSTVFQQPQQLLIPQRFEMSSPPPLTSRIPQGKKKLQQETEISPAPVFIVQKLDSPLLIRQPQNKIRFQSPNLSSDNINENSFQSVSKQLEKNTGNMPQANQEFVKSKSQGAQQIDMQEKISVTDLQNQGNKFSLERCQTIGQVKVGVIEQSTTTRLIEPVNKTKIFSATLTRTPNARIKTTEQQTEPIIVNKEMNALQFERFASNMQSQSPTTSSHVQTQAQNQNQVTPNRGTGRGTRGGLTVQLPGIGNQYTPRAKGIHVQTSPPRLPNIEAGDFNRNIRPTRGVSRGGRGGWGYGLGQRQAQVRPGTSPVVHTILPSSDANQNSNENVEEARMLVLLLNGEKKMIRIPCSQQNIFLGQILQQAGLSVTAPTSIAVEQVIDISNTDQSKSPISSNQLTTISKAFNAGQLNAATSSLEAPSNALGRIQQQQSGGQSSRLQQITNVAIPRQHLEFASPRIAISTSVQSIVSSSNLGSDIVSSHSQTTQSMMPPSSSAKEEPRFISGYMAICPYCGIQSLDFNKCIRCKRKLPENVKSKSIFNAEKMRSDKATAENEKSSDGSKAEAEEKQFDSSASSEKEKTSLLQVQDKKKVRPCIKKKKISDEPAEILILSSDEEEVDNALKKTDLNKQILAVLRKEPVYVRTELSEGEMNSIMKEKSLNEDLMKNIQPGSFTTLQCRTIRVGSYKVQPKERVLISNKAIRLVVSSLKNESAVIVIPITDVVKVLLHFGKHSSVIFIYPQPKVGVQIRSILGMNDKLGPYYDPASSEEETHKRITLLLEKISEDNKITLQKIFGQEKLEELSEKETNEILLRASPFEIQSTGLSKSMDTVRKIMVYPPPPEKGGITLNNQDYACLGEDQFLNDVIIDFYLKYLMLKVLSPEDRNRTHVFSTFFYKRLTTKPKSIRKNDPENDPKLSPAEKRHMRVKGWTKQVNLFEKDFIIVPINEHSHWFLAIICFPGLTGPVRFSDNTPVEPEEILPKKNAETLQIGNTTITHIIKSDGSTISLQLECGSDRDEAEGDQDDLHPSSDDEESEQTEDEINSTPPAVQIPLLMPVPQTQFSAKETKVKPVKRKIVKEPIKQPCILIFDSLAGASRVRVVATLRDYLKVEFKAKMGQNRDFNKDTIKGAVPKVPQQNNFTDCGLYLLQYVESFFQDPLYDFKLPLKYLQEWFPEEVVSCKRQKLANLIRSLMEEQGIKVEEMGLPVLTFSNGSNVMDNQSRMEDEDEEMDDEEEEEEMNEEDEEALKNQGQISDFDNEDEDMDLGGEEEEEDDDEDDEDDDDELENEEELEVGEIPRRWLARSRSSCNELESSIVQGECPSIKTSPLVDYDDSESEEEECYTSISCASEVFGNDRTAVTGSAEPVQGKFCKPVESQSLETGKSVPATDLQDFESQITCSTIEKNVESKNNESDMAISDEEEVEEECEIALDEEESSFDSSGANNFVAVTPSLNKTVPLVERRHSILSNETEQKMDEKSMEVTNIIKKLVNDKNITISRKEEEINNSNLFKKNLEIRQFKAKDCDRDEEVKKISTSCVSIGAAATGAGGTPAVAATQKNNFSTQKRTYQALKSVRIPKKTERKLEIVGGKKQKLEKT